jgi:hypothetical protein
MYRVKVFQAYLDMKNLIIEHNAESKPAALHNISNNTFLFNIINIKY